MRTLEIFNLIDINLKRIGKKANEEYRECADGNFNVKNAESFILNALMCDDKTESEEHRLRCQEAIEILRCNSEYAHDVYHVYASLAKNNLKTKWSK